MRIIRGFHDSDQLFLTLSDIEDILNGKIIGEEHALVITLEGEPIKDLKSQDKG